jgi:hypothetical protein
MPPYKLPPSMIVISIVFILSNLQRHPILYLKHVTFDIEISMR